MANETPKIWSLYRITNKINNKVYIGQAADVSKRWYDHRKAVKLNNPTQTIHYALIKYGLDSFEFEVIASCKTQDDANCIETELVKQYDSFIKNGKGYNVTLGGMNAPKTEEWKRKVSEKLMGHEVTQETRDKVSKGNTGKVRTANFKQNVGDFFRGKGRTEAHRENLSESLKGNQNFLGHKHSEETKQKLSKIAEGRAPSDMAHQKSVEKTKGRTWKLIDGKRIWMDK